MTWKNSPGTGSIPIAFGFISSFPVLFRDCHLAAIYNTFRRHFVAFSASSQDSGRPPPHNKYDDEGAKGRCAGPKQSQAHVPSSLLNPLIDSTNWESQGSGGRERSSPHICPPMHEISARGVRERERENKRRAPVRPFLARHLLATQPKASIKKRASRNKTDSPLHHPIYNGRRVP